MINLGTAGIGKIYLGPTEVLKIYQGTIIVYDKSTPIPGENYLSGYSPLAINNGLIGYHPGDVIDNGDGTYTAVEGSSFSVTTKYKADNNDMFAVRINGGEDFSFGLVDRYEIRGLFGMGAADGGQLFIVLGNEYIGWESGDTVSEGDWLILKYTIAGSVKTLIPYKSTDGVNLVALTPPEPIIFQDYAGAGNAFLAFNAEPDTTISYPQGKDLTLAP